MKKDKQAISRLLIGAAGAILLSPIPAFFAAAATVREAKVGYIYLTASLLVFGIGEVLNHPAHSGNRYTKDNEAHRFYRFHQRKRFPSGAGNLMLICSILFFFIGIGKLIAA